MKKKFEDLTCEELWKLRKEIVLNSIYYADYVNSFDFNSKDVCYFFDGYIDYIDELAEEEEGTLLDMETLFEKYDNKENLWSWFNCFDDLSWVRHCEKEEIVSPNSMTFFFQNIFNK